MKTLRGLFVWLLVGAGVAGIAYPALAYGTGALRQARLSAEVKTLLGPGPAISASSPAAGLARPAPLRTAARPKSIRVQAARSNPVPVFRPVEGQALGLIEIPSIGLQAAFLEGVSDQTLMAGPGHLPGTMLPGSPDVSVLAAHRDTHFRNLKDVGIGDSVVLRLPSGLVDYRVTRRAIASPEDRWVTTLRGRPMLRLVTCWPPNFIGPAPLRLVVTAIPRTPQAMTAQSVRWRPNPAEAGPESAGTGSGGGRGTPTTALADPLPGRTVEPAFDPSAIALTSSDRDGLLSPGSLPPIGTAGATGAGLAAFGAFRSRRRLAWWFLPWMGGLGLAMLTLLAAWAGPGLIRTV
jgi:sortase A